MSEMSELADDNHDMTRGVYRRQYAGFVGGTRINRVSLEAEAWFWRVHAAADDYGNCAGEPSMLYAITVGRRARAVSIDRVVELVGELIAEGLLLEYESAGERYLNVAGFVDIQPSGRNGKRVHRVPASPWDGGGNGPADPHGADAAGAGRGTPKGRSERSLADGSAARKRRGGPVGSVDPPANASPGESGGIQTIPKVAGNSQQHHYHDHNHDQSSLNAPPAAEGEGDGWSFPCVGRPATWWLPASSVAAFVSDFPDLDVIAELEAARALLGVDGKGKPAGQMAGYVHGWLERSQRNPQMRARRATPAKPRARPASSAPGGTKSTRTQRVAERLAQEIHDEQQRLSISQTSRAAAPAGDGRAVG